MSGNEALAGRPTFGERAEGATAPTTSPTSTENKSFDRIEAGAVWQKTSKAGRTFLSMSFKIEELETLLSEAKTAGTKSLNLVAFTNNKGGVETRPDYRIYGEKSN